MAVLVICILISKVKVMVNRDLKILDAAALKNAVTSERAWVVTATFSRCASGGRNE